MNINICSNRLAHCLLFVISALSVSGALAQSGASVSGLIDVEVNSQTVSANGERVTSLNGKDPGPNGGLQTSYLQFAGNEELGDGLKAGFTLGAFFQPGNGDLGRFTGDTFFSRDANVNLSGDFGKIELGRQINPIYLSMLLFDPFEGSFSYSPIVAQTYHAFSAGNVLSADTGYSSAVSYSTPDYMGLTATLLYSPSGESGTAGSSSANLLYFNGPFAATVAYENSTASGASNNTYTLGGGYPVGTTEKVAQAGFSYNFAPVKLFLQYENSDTQVPGTSSLTLDTYQVGTLISVGQGNILAAYAKTGGNVDHRTGSIGYDYFLSKRTDLYIAYMNDQAAAYLDTISSIGIGIRYRF